MRSSLPILALLLAGTLAYLNHLSNPTVFDDEGNIAGNQSIRDLWSMQVFQPQRELGQAGRPVANLTFAVNYALGGLDLVGYRVFNLAIHLLCAVLLFAVARRLLYAVASDTPSIRGPTFLAFSVALLWTVHPLNTEAVSYLTQRTESLMAAFYLLTVYASLRALVAGPRARWWSVLAVVSCALGMASKESMVTAPVMVVLIDRTFFFKSFAHAIRERRVLYAGLAGTWLILAALLSTGPRSASAGFTAGVSAWTYLLNQAPLILRYLGLAVWPDSLVAYYGSPVTVTLGDVLPAFIAVALLGAVTLAALRWYPRLGFLGAWFFITLAPASSIVPIATEVGAERRMYLPVAAVIAAAVLLAAWAWQRLASRHRALERVPAALVAGALVIAISLPLAWLTVRRNREYASALTLAQVTLDRYPTADAHHVLAEILLAAGRRDEAMVQLRAAVPSATRAHYTLGRELYRAGQLDDAIPHLEAFVARHPRLVWSTDAYGLLGEAYEVRGDWRRAAEAFRQVLARSPDNVAAERGLADALIAGGRHQEAIALYRRVFRATAPDADGVNQLGIAFASTGQLAEAVEAFRQAVSLDPGHVVARLNLALALCRHGDVAAAIAQAGKAVTQQPDDQGAQALLDHLRSVEAAPAAGPFLAAC